MSFIIEFSILAVLVVVHSVFGLGLLLFGTPTFLLLGYDFANTLNILMPVSIIISGLQFFKSESKDRNFVSNYNLYCLPFLALFLILALSVGDKVDFKLFVALLLFFTSIVVLNKNEFKFFANKLLKFKKIILIVIGSLHGFSNMGGSFLSLYSSLLSKNKKELTRYYISYGYLTMGIIQYLIVLIISYKSLDFSKLYYTLIAIILYYPAQKIFLDMDNKKFSKYVNILALLYGAIIILSYLD